MIKNAERMGVAEVVYAAAAELSRRGSTFDIKRTVEVLTEIAAKRGLLGYKELFEVHSDAPWNHTKVAEIARHLEAVAYFCMDNNRVLQSQFVRFLSFIIPARFTQHTGGRLQPKSVHEILVIPY